MLRFKEKAEMEYKTITAMLDRIKKENYTCSGSLIKHHGVSGTIYYLRSYGAGRAFSRRISTQEAFRIQHKRFRKELYHRLKVDAALLRQIDNRFLPYDTESVWDALPPAYRPEADDLKKLAAESNQAENRESLKLYKPNVKIVKGRVPEDVLAMLREEGKLDIPSGKRFESRIIITDEPNDTPNERPTKTMSGRVVRSVSEGLIGSILEAMGIPYITDRKVELKVPDGSRKNRCPDFIIICPDGFIFIWEHLGLLNSPRYCRDVGEKLYLYSLNGIHPGYNLILTADNTQSGIDADTILQVIETYILPHFR